MPKELVVKNIYFIMPPISSQCFVIGMWKKPIISSLAFSCLLRISSLGGCVFLLFLMLQMCSSASVPEALFSLWPRSLRPFSFCLNTFCYCSLIDPLLAVTWTSALQFSVTRFPQLRGERFPALLTSMSFIIILLQSVSEYQSAT